MVDYVCENAITDYIHLLPNSVFRFNSNSNASLIKEWFGWYQPEPWGTWSNGERSYIYLNVDKVESDDACLLINGQSVLSEKHPRNRFRIFLNGKYAAQFTQTLERPNTSGYVHIPIATIKAANNGNLTLKLSSLDPISPSSLSKGADTRVLGFGITDLQLVQCASLTSNN